MKQTKKFLMTVATLGLVAPCAFAGSLNLDMRVDYLSQNYNDAAQTAAVGLNNYKFVFNTGRIDYKGKLNEDTSFRLRYRFATKDQGAVTKRDSANATLDYAYVAHKIDMATVTVGKWASEVGGFEGNTSSTDQYLLSEAYSGTSYLAGTTTYLTGYSTELYVTGLKVGLKLADDHNLSLQVANTDTAVGRAPTGTGDSLTGTKFSQDNTLAGITYKGFFMDKSLGLLASYHTEQTNDDTTKVEYTSVGAQYMMNGFTGQLDYLSNSYKASETQTDTLISTVATLKYDMDTLTPIVKYVSSEEKLDGTPSTKNKYTSYGAALEWKPVKDDMYRYHVAYNNRTMKPETGDDRNLTEYFVGMRINADFLK